MKKLLFYSCVPVIILIVMSTKSDPAISNPRTGSEEFHANMRKLWEDHATWTRNVIFNVMDEMPGNDEAMSRLLKNQNDIGNAMKPYYGDEGARELTVLLRSEVSQAVELMKAAKLDDGETFGALYQQWLAGADDIADLLSKENPDLKNEMTKKMLHDYLKFTVEEANARHKGDYFGDVSAYDKVHNQALLVADMLSDGIIDQFPDKFNTAWEN